MARRPLVTVVVLGIMLALAPTARTAAADRFQTLLDQTLADEDLTGGVLLVSAPHLRRVVVAGMADRARRTPVTPDSRFYVASTGKMMVAVAVLQLVQEGRLALDARAAPLAAGVPAVSRVPNAAAARVGQLLDHSAGIPDYLTDAFAAATTADPAHRWTAAEALAFTTGLKPTGRAGRSHAYSNSHFVLLGDIVASVDGAPLDAVLARRVFAPAGMTATTVGARPDMAGLAHGYVASDDGEKDSQQEDVSLPSWSSVLGDGPMVTTAGDLERFLFALFRDGALLTPEMLRRMVTPSPHEVAYGLGVTLGEDDWGIWYGHAGSYDGFEADARYYPERKAAIVFLTNGNASADLEIVDAAAAALFGRR